MLFNLAIGRQLIANCRGRAHRHHAEAFIFQGFLILERVEISPGGVEFAGMSHTGQIEGARIAHGQRKVDITPMSAGQRFQLPMREGGGVAAVMRTNMPAIVKYRAIIAELAHESGHLAAEIVNDLAAISQPSFSIRWIKTGLEHGVCGPDRAVVERVHDIEEETVHRQRIEDIFDMRL